MHSLTAKTKMRKFSLNKKGLGKYIYILKKNIKKKGGGAERKIQNICQTNLETQNKNCYLLFIIISHHCKNT